MTLNSELRPFFTPEIGRRRRRRRIGTTLVPMMYGGTSLKILNSVQIIFLSLM
jgi:hypothetical protein